jgi:hypothetical protein
MKTIIISILMLIPLFANAQFTYLGGTTGDIILTLNNAQKVGTLDAFAKGKSLTFVKHQYAVHPIAGKELYDLFSAVNDSTDALMLRYPAASNYSQLLDSLETRFANEEILRAWLDAIVTKKVLFCTDPAILAPLSNSGKWDKYLELLRQQ